jgi:general secretion pathway protein D
MKPRIMFLITFTLIFYSSFVMPAISANVDQGKPITLDAKDNDIRDVLAGLAKANGFNLVMGSSVQGRINIALSNVPFMKAVDLIAKSSGFVVEKVDNTIIVAKSDEIKELLPKTSKVIPLQYTSATELKQAVSGVALEGVEIVADQRTNSIFVTGLERSVQKLEEIVKLLDVPVSAKPQVPVSTKIFLLKYASAATMQQTITNFCSSVGKINIDERTNSLIITDQPAVFDKISEIITQLDVQTEAEKQKVILAQLAQKEPAPPPVLLTQVFNLDYIEGSAIIPAIQAILSTSGKVESVVKRKDIVIVESRSGGSGKGESGGGSTGMSNFYKEKWSDTLVVTDIPENVEKVTALIAELDTKLPQVRIEAKMVEVELTGKDQLGISWSGIHKPSGSTFDGNFPAAIDNGVDIKLGTISAKYFEDIMLRIQALETTGQAKLISNPSVIAIDNELAQMIVADKIPLLSTYETQFSSSTQVEFINIGVMLNVVPHITEDGYILVDAMPVVDSIKQWTTGANPQPIISSRVAHCRVRVKDGETFVIGGLVKDELIQSSDHVPFLGKIPLIGRLFGTSTKNKTKSDLVVFITPKIIKDDTQ